MILFSYFKLNGGFKVSLFWMLIVLHIFIYTKLFTIIRKKFTISMRKVSRYSISFGFWIRVVRHLLNGLFMLQNLNFMIRFWIATRIVYNIQWSLIVFSIMMVGFVTAIHVFSSKGLESKIILLDIH